MTTASRPGVWSLRRVDEAAPAAGAAASSIARISPERRAGRRKRRWAINGDFLTLRPTGVARYAREVTTQLDALIAEGHPLARDLDLELIIPREVSTPFAHIPTRLVREFNHPRLPQFWVQMQLPLHIKGGLLSFCNLAPVAVKHHIVCIHDLHTRIMPESYGFFHRWAHHLILPLLGRRAARITTVSSLSREHLVRYGVAPRGKIVVTYNGSDHARRWDPDGSELAIGSEDEGPRPFVLCLGRSLKYKNMELLVRLAPLLDKIGLDLYMAGDIDMAALSREGAYVPDNIRLLGRISDDDFAKALTGALCFLFPSRIEGFGLPAVEAMALGCPVVASTAPCLPEVCGDAALYADPDDTNAWLGAIARLKEDGELRQQIVDLGHTRAATYSWRASAERYLELMAEVDADCGLGHGER